MRNEIGGGLEPTLGDTPLTLERLLFFSDAVFAIAITLLILEIEVPHLPRAAEMAQQGRALLELLPSVFAFVLSFLVIGRFWMGHHDRMGDLRHYSPALMWPNLLYLMAIAAMPFATAFLGKNLGMFVPALVYNLMLLVTASLGLILSRRVIRLAREQGSSSPGGAEPSVVLGALVSVALTFVSAPLSQWGMVTIPLWQRLLRWRGSSQVEQA